MFWYSKKWSTKTLFNSLFPQCRWGCLYYKVLSLFSQSLYNRNRHRAARHRRAAAAATALPLLPPCCCHASQSTATICVVVRRLRRYPLSALLSIVCFAVCHLHHCSSSASMSGWRRCCVRCPPSCALLPIICVNGCCLHCHPSSVSSSIVCIVIHCVHHYPLCVSSSVMCIVVRHVHCCPSSALPSVVCVIV
jgi:hypothetical protein